MENKKNSEEIDLGQLFIIIGNGFKNVFNSIINLFKAVFHYLLLALLFLKRYAIVLAVAALVGGLLGYFTESSHDPKYQSNMVVEANFNSGYNLYNQIDYLNSLIKEKQTDKLADIFEISKSEASRLKTFEVEPYQKDKNINIEFEKYLKETDTIFTFGRGYNIENFKARFYNSDFKLQNIKVIAQNNFDFSKLTSGMLKIIENDYFKNILNLKKKGIYFEKEAILKDLNEVDSLRALYKQVELLSVKKDNRATTNIELGQKGVQSNPQLELFEKRDILLQKLNNINDRIAHETFIVKAISNFNSGAEYKNIIEKKWVKFAILSFLLAFFIIVLLKLNSYLKQYEEEKINTVKK